MSKDPKYKFKIIDHINKNYLQIKRYLRTFNGSL